MQFAKVFDVDGTQVLCVLQPSEEDGAPEIRVVTYVGRACVTFGNRLIEVGAEVVDREKLFRQTKALFDGMGQEEAEDAYRVALRMMSEAARGESDDDEDDDESVDREDASPEDADLPSWMRMPMPSRSVH